MPTRGAIASAAAISAVPITIVACGPRQGDTASVATDI
jgi:hypothetical protein